MAWIKRHLVALSLTACFLLGLGLLLYPSISDYWNTFHQSQAIQSYAKSVEEMSEKDYQLEIEEALKYNQQLKSKGINWRLSEEEKALYQATLNIDENGSMGYISITKIDVKLSIFHGTEDKVLHSAVGHIAGSSLPIGGDSSHSVLSAHRGLPSAKLFSELDKLREGDTFTLHILNETLTYEVDKIRVVLPTDLSELLIEDGKDYCTLVTCTPYGVNTHRLLVRAHRIANADGDVRLVADALQIKPLIVAPLLALPVLLLLLFFIFLVTSSFYQKRKVNVSELYFKERKLSHPQIWERLDRTSWWFGLLEKSHLKKRK